MNTSKANGPAIQANTDRILSVVDQVERETNSPTDRLTILEAVIADLRCRVAATKEDVRRDRAAK